MSFSTFIADQSAVRDRGDWLIQLYPLNESGVETVLKFSRRGTSTGSSTITVGTDTIDAHQLFRKRLLKAPVTTQSLWSPGQILSSSVPSFGSGLFNNADGGLDQYRNWDFSGRRFKVFFCDQSDIQNTIGKVADGFMGDPKFDLPTVEIPFLGRESLFDASLSTRVYRGTGYMLELSGARVVSFGTPAAANLTGNMTATEWMWIDSGTSSNARNWGWYGGTRVPWQFNINTDRTLGFRTHIAGVAQGPSATTTVLGLNKFYHIAVVVSGVDVTFYIWDDALQALTTETFTSAFSSATRDSNVGCTYVVECTGTRVIWHDEARLWNVARTLSEITADRYRELPSGSLSSSLVHYLRYNDGTGTTVTDSSASAVNGTISGAGASTWLHSQEGGPELAGTPKPFCNGEKFGAAPVLVDPVRQGYDVGGGEAINNLTSYEGGLSHTMDASAASFRAYLTTTPAAGHSLRYLPRGLFKLGSQPALPVSASVEGYNSGALGYVNKGATVARDIITRRGPKLIDPTDLDTASFTTYGTANTGTIGLYYKAPRPKEDTIKSALDSIMKSGAGWWGYVGSSTLFHVEKFAGPAAIADYNFKSNQVIRNSLTPIKIEAVIWKVVVRYRRNEVVLTEDQVAASIKSTTGWQQFTMEWQEKEDHDDALLARYPGAASTVLQIDTLLQYDADAQALATYLLGIVKGKKRGWQVSVGSTGLDALMGKTGTLTVAHQDGITRLGLDGLTKYSILTVSQSRQEGQVNLQLWGPAT